MARLYRRGKVWWGRIQRENRELRRSLKTTDRRTGEKRLRDWLDELDAVAWGERPRRSWQQGSEKFIREHLTTLKPSSAQRYIVSLKGLAEHFGNKMLHEISSAELSSFETKRRTHGVSAGTIRRDLACLSSLMTSAIDWEWLPDSGNPVPSYMRRRAKRGLKEAPPRTRYLSFAEEARLLAAASPHVQQAIILAVETGLRSSELFSLTWTQIDLTRGIIATTTKTKSGRIRHVPVTPRARTILGTIIRRIDSPYVLVNPDTGTRYVHLIQGFEAARGRAALAGLVFHDLRRTAGCRWLQRDGKTMAEVSMMLGHSGVAITEQRYAFLEAEAVAESLAGPHKSRHSINGSNND